MHAATATRGDLNDRTTLELNRLRPVLPAADDVHNSR
jgi:hypothetical protein